MTIKISCLKDYAFTPSYLQQPDQSIHEFLSTIRIITKYCDFPTSFADEAIRDAFCLGLSDLSLKKAVCRKFSSFCRQENVLTLNDAMATAEVENSARLTVSYIEPEVETEMVAPIHTQRSNACFCFRQFT